MGPGRDSREKALEQRADGGLASKPVRTWLTQLSSPCQDREGPAGVRESWGARGVGVPPEHILSQCTLSMPHPPFNTHTHTPVIIGQWKSVNCLLFGK